MTDKPWEDAVAQVSLAGRTEEIADMWRPWKAAVDEGGDLDWLRGQLESLIESVADNWQGRDGAMFQQKAQSIGDLIDAIQRNYQAMWSCLNTSRATLTDAKKSIPIPVFGGRYLNGTPIADHPNASNPTLDYGLLYRDYQASGGGQHYDDFKSRAATLLAQAASHNERVDLHGEGWGNASTNIHVDYSVNMWTRTRQGTPHAMNEAQIKQAAAQAAEYWYNANAPLATKAMETLRTDYAQQAAALPPPITQRAVGDSVHPQHPSAQPSGWSGSTGSVTGSAVPTGGTGFPDWSSAAAASNPAHSTGLPSQPDTGSSNSSGLSGVGTATGQSSASGLGTGSGLYGGGGAAAGGGFGGAGGLPSTGIGGVTGSGTPTEPIGVATDPRSFWDSAAASGVRATGYGSPFMGAPGALSGQQQRDEHLSWLTEDDDVFSVRPEDLPPDLT